MAIQKPRKADEILADRFLFLLSVRESERYGSMKLTKLQKMFFYAEYLMNKKKEHGFNLLFRRHRFGPYSDDLEKDMKDLASVNFIKIEDRGISIDEYGEIILSETKDLISSNRWVLETITQSAKKIVPLANDDVLNFVYQLPIKTRFGEKVEDIPDGGTIVKPLEERESRKKLLIDENWIETLDVLFDIRTSKNLFHIIERQQNAPIPLLPYVVD